MIELGGIPIRDERAIVEARIKIRILAEDLNFGSIAATRLATISSEMSRWVLATDKASSIEVGLDKRDGTFGLALLFPSGQTRASVSIKTLNRIFDEVEEFQTADGLQSIKTFKFLPDPEFEPTEEFIGIAKELVQRLTREELYAQLREAYDELTASNRELQREIEKRNQVEDALRESERRFRETTDLLPTIICETGIDMRLTYMNGAGLNSLGYSQTDIELGIKLIDLIHPDDKAKLAQHTDEILQGRDLVANEYGMLRKDGSGIAVFVNLAPIHKEGRIVGIRASIADINELKNLQARLLEAQKMEAIATLAGGIAHEFNNALGAIYPNIDMLKMKFPDNREMNKYVKPMYSSARRMARLTSQMLAYARGGKYLPQNISLSSFVRETLPLIKHTIAPSIHVEKDLQDGVPNVEADLTQLQMVLLAVVVNASEAIEGKGYIRIISRSEEITEEFAKHHPDLKPGSYVCLRIEDNGSGMAEETRKKVFEPFFTTKFQGRGLGMAAVYGIVKNHDGFVSVDSELRKGTVVRIYLPTVG
jgi:PAS domain S-box-containing protein